MKRPRSAVGAEIFADRMEAPAAQHGRVTRSRRALAWTSPDQQFAPHAPRSPPHSATDTTAGGRRLPKLRLSNCAAPGGPTSSRTEDKDQEAYPSSMPSPVSASLGPVGVREDWMRDFHEQRADRRPPGWKATEGHQSSSPHATSRKECLTEISEDACASLELAVQSGVLHVSAQQINSGFLARQRFTCV